MTAHLLRCVPLPFSFCILSATLRLTPTNVHSSQGSQSPPHPSYRQLTPDCDQRPGLLLRTHPPSQSGSSSRLHFRHRPCALPFFSRRPHLLRRRVPSAPHQHVSALRLAAYRRQHALSVGLRRQCRGFLRPPAVPVLLHRVWIRRRRPPCAL